jgi:hypothetical protein
MARGYNAREGKTPTSSAGTYTSIFKEDNEFSYTVGKEAGDGKYGTIRNLKADQDSLNKAALEALPKLSAENQAKMKKELSFAKQNIDYIEQQADIMTNATGENNDTPPDETPEWEDAEAEIQESYEEYIKSRDIVAKYIDSTTNDKKNSGYNVAEAFTVQARTYPNVWREKTMGELDKLKNKKSTMSESEAREAWGDRVAEMSPQSIPRAMEAAKKAVNKVYDILKNELPASTLRPFSNQIKESNGFLRLSAAFESPTGTLDVREIANVPVEGGNTFGKSREAAEEFITAVNQLVAEHGSDHRESIGGVSKPIEERRNKKD